MNRSKRPAGQQLTGRARKRAFIFGRAGLTAGVSTNPKRSRVQRLNRKPRTGGWK